MGYLIFSAIRIFALLDLGLCSISEFDGTNGFFEIILIDGLWSQLQIKVFGGHIHSVDSLLNKFLTILSSKEWYEITTNLPPLPNYEMDCSSEVSNAFISSFTAILRALKVWVAGWILFFFLFI